MTTKNVLKQSRWVHIHKNGEKKYEPATNQMLINISKKLCEASVTFKVVRRFNIKLAAEWMLKYLTNAGATALVETVTEPIMAEAIHNKDVEINNDSWRLSIVKTDEGAYKCYISWIPKTAVEKYQPKKRIPVAKKTASVTKKAENLPVPAETVEPKNDEKKVA